MEAVKFVSGHNLGEDTESHSDRRTEMDGVVVW